MPFVTLNLNFGRDGRFSGDLEAGRLLGRFEPPAALPDVPAVVRNALGAPIDYPPLQQCLVPGDRVVIVLDRRMPEAATLIGGVWEQLAQREIVPQDVTILQPADYSAGQALDPRTALPAEARTAIRWHVHDPLDAGACGYLSTTAAGERIYMARELLEADFAIVVGRVAFDRLWGYCGLQSVLYPGLSTVEALKKAHGQPHDELEADDSRPLRQMAEEVAWLLGVQFGLAAVPSAGTGLSLLLAGQLDSIMRRATEALNAGWRFSPPSQPELALVTVEADAGGHGWEQLASALHAARKVVVRDGRIAVLTQLEAPLTDGLQLIRDSRQPRDALRPLREQAPPDLLAATALAQAVEWANVYLYSRLDPDLVEDLFMVPLGGLDEAQRLLTGDEPCIVLSGGQGVCIVPAGG